MNKKYLLSTLSLVGAVLSGCASQPTATFKPFQAEDLNSAVSSGALQQKTNHFLVINDSSSSTNISYTNQGFTPGSEPSKFNVEKELLSRLNKTIPNIPLTSGLRSFGFGSCVDMGMTKLNQAVGPYSKSAFDNAINSLECNSGGSPMAEAIDAAKADLTSTSGNVALIILSDAHELDASPIPALKELKAQYGKRLCVYPIWVGNPDESQGRITMNQLADTGGCGFTASATDIASSSGMSKYVQQVFFGKAAVAAPIAPVVVVDGDDDRDGVKNSKDQCPNTPYGATVNVQGCWILKGIHFDTAKYDIKAQYYPLLDNVVKVIQNNPGLNIEIQGHTDNVGTAAYNLKLSDNRAKSVREYLKNKVGKDAGLTSKGYGFNQPVDTNATEQGRANNRRVQLNVLK
jgi:OOP family OmpA-OmpF porin